MTICSYQSCVLFPSSAGAIEVLTPFLTFQHFQSLPAIMSFAFLAGRQESGSTSALLSSIPDGIDNLIDVLDNTVNRRGGKEYDYGVSQLL